MGVEDGATARACSVLIETWDVVREMRGAGPPTTLLPTHQTGESREIIVRIDVGRRIRVDIHERHAFRIARDKVAGAGVATYPRSFLEHRFGEKHRMSAYAAIPGGSDLAAGRTPAGDHPANDFSIDAGLITQTDYDGV